eukprot:m.1197713 g.1197713  ORF g.1197713 m.1197713 type:complete len:79 (-) comp24568_c0_seq1:54-290(-)
MIFRFFRLVLTFGIVATDGICASLRLVTSHLHIYPTSESQKVVLTPDRTNVANAQVCGLAYTACFAVHKCFVILFLTH